MQEDGKLVEHPNLIKGGDVRCWCGISFKYDDEKRTISRINEDWSESEVAKTHLMHNALCQAGIFSTNYRFSVGILNPFSNKFHETSSWDGCDFHNDTMVGQMRVSQFGLEI